MTVGVSRRRWICPWLAATWAVLFAAFGLRVSLALSGGQQFWPDEDRFEFARTCAKDLLAGRYVAGANAIFGSADHILFKACAVLPALAERVFHSGPWLPALFFALTSTAVLWAVGTLSAAAGGGERERFFVVFAASASCSLFYYSRHFVPYDLSLFFFLVAFAGSVAPRRTFAGACGIGFLGACGFLSYNGYWTLIAALFGILLASATTPEVCLKSLAGFLVGFAVPNLAAFGIGKALGVDLLASYVTFSRTVSQGDYGQGWRFIGEYFWHAEGLNVGVFLAALVAAAVLAWRSELPDGAFYGALIMVVIYALVILGSDVFQVLTVAARHVRALAPFGAWVVGSLLGWLAGRGFGGRIVTGCCCAFILFGCVQSFSMPLAQVFPRDFPDKARSAIAADRHSGGGVQPLRMANDGFLHNPAWNVQNPPRSRVLWSRPHPFAFVPYLYEGYSESLRRRFLEHDRSMKILSFEGATPISHYPYAFRLSFVPEPERSSEDSEPIVGSGAIGAGDLIYLKYLPGDTAMVGLDHFGSKATESKSFPFARGLEHTLVVIAPCLVSDSPSAPNALGNSHRWTHEVYVAVDGKVVMDIQAIFFPSREDSITVGLNLIHSTSSQASLELTDPRFAPLSAGEWAEAEANP